MTNKSQQEHLRDAERVLAEVREMIAISDDGGDINELNALQMLLEVTKALHSAQNITELITLVLDSTIAFAKGSRAFLMLIDEEGQPRFKMGRDRHGNYLSREDFSPSSTVINEVLDVRRTLVVPDAQADEYLNKRESIQNFSLRTIMCSPMILKGEIMGLLYVDSHDTPLPYYSKTQINVLASLSDQAAVAIRNAQKFETHD